MKQSKKLLSIFLAMLMLLGTVSVIGNAALVQNEIAYDSIDNAKLTPEQVATVVLDMVDNELLAGMDDVDLAGIISLRLSQGVSAVLQDLVDLRGGGTWTAAQAIIGDAKNLNFDPIKKEGSWNILNKKEKAWTRADGDLKVILQLLEFIGANASLLSKIGGGLGTKEGLSLGTILNGVLDLGEVQAILNDLPGFLTKTVFDMLLYGSYGYDKDSEELGGNLPGDANTLDKIVNQAIKGLLTKPQQYTYNDKGEKVWDMESKILGDKGADISIDFKTDSVFSVLDKALPIAYETFGTVVLNHDVKKIFMEAMGADFVVLDAVKDKAEIDKIKADSDYINVEDANVDASSVKNYFCNAQMWKVDDTWYFRDYVTRETGEFDKDGNPITAKVHRYQRAEAYDVDELFEAVNWDYYLTASDLDFTALIQQYGSLVGCLNHILCVVFEKALNPAYLAKMGTSVNALWADGGNENFNENLMRVAKFLLTNYTFMFFGRNPEYVDLNTLKAKPDFVQKINSFAETDEGREGLIAYMLLPFLGDALPQLVYSTDMFTSGLQIEQTAALLVREFLSDLTPQINYDDQIFVDPAAGKKQFKAHSSEEWMNIVLNMGLDLAACYLDNIANFGVDLNALKDLHTITKDANGNAVQPWQVVLEEIVDWAVLYVGKDGYSVIKGLEPGTLGVERCITYNYENDSYSFDKSKFVGGSGKGSAFYTISTALNTLLPLGIVNGCSSDTFGLDVETLFNKVKKDIIPSLNLEALIGLFGRNNHETNFLNYPLYKEVLDLVNQLLGCIIVNKDGNKILQVDVKAKEILANAISKDSLKATIYALLSGLSDRREPLLRGILPVLAVFISGWGTENSFKTPTIDIDSTMTWTESGNGEFKIINGSKGIWRSYMNGTTRSYDAQYQLVIENVKSYDVNGAASSLLTISSNGAGTYGAGGAGTVKYSVSPVSGGGLARVEVTYNVLGPDGKQLSDKSFTKSEFVWINNTNGDETELTYDAEALDKLRELVDYEFHQCRVPADYDFSNPVCGEYTTALVAAARGARQNFNGSSVLNFAELYDNLKAKADAIEAAKKAETAQSGLINTLKSTVETAEKTLGGKNYRTYMLYRWYKFNDELKDAKNAIELERRVKLGVETQNFNYSSLTANEVTELLKLQGNGTYADYVKATFTPMTEDEAARAQQEYRNIKSDLAGYQTGDLANTNKLITVNQGRLIKRTDKPVTTYLENEIASAGTLNEADYTAMSWKNFKAALDNANAAKSSDSQDTIFAAKYALQVARNGLVLKGDEADYTELKAVIVQANAALTNASSYENGAADFGAVLVALGYEVKDANGNTINLYPGSAIDVEDIPYGTHDQDEIDDAADELKRALAKLKFKNLNTGSVGVENKEFGTGEFDETTNTEIKESVLVKNVAKEQKATDVAALVKALGDDVTVSLDETYSASVDTDLFVGTGSTITVFKKQGDVKVPVATIKVVVNGDVNGDGVIDVLDCSSVELASHGLVVYNGVYGLAADVATGADGNITIDDVQAVVGLAKAS